MAFVSCEDYNFFKKINILFDTINIKICTYYIPKKNVLKKKAKL